MPTHPNHLFSSESLSCSVATGNNAAHFAWFPQERALLWKTTIEESLQVPREPQGFALLVVVSAVSWKMVWNWEDPSELWEGKLHPSQLLTNGKRKHQSDKPGAEVSGCGVRGVAHPAESCPGGTGCPCRLVQGGFCHGWVRLPAHNRPWEERFWQAGRWGQKVTHFPAHLLTTYCALDPARGTGHSMVTQTSGFLFSPQNRYSGSKGHQGPSCLTSKPREKPFLYSYCQRHPALLAASRTWERITSHDSLSHLPTASAIQKCLFLLSKDQIHTEPHTRLCEQDILYKCTFLLLQAFPDWCSIPTFTFWKATINFKKPQESSYPPSINKDNSNNKNSN